VFGSIIAFAAFAWLMRVANPARVSTYGFVNPVVAVLVGWFLGGEALSPRLLVAAGMMVTGVATIVTGAQPRRSPGTGSSLVNSRGSGPSPTRT
ncbi:MAG: EamA family transporter, partial [Acidobacteriota bacterium]